MPDELPKWLTNDGSEASMARVLGRIAGRERRIRATAPKPDRGPRISQWRAQPPASVHWTREAWEAIYPDLDAAWWKPWPDAPMPHSFDIPEFLRKMGAGSSGSALGRYVRDQYRGAHEPRTDRGQPIPCVPDPDDPDYERERPGIVSYWAEGEA